MRIDVGIIGGTGIGERLLAYPGTPLHIPTREGTQRGRLVEVDGLRLFLTSRHSAGHKVPPHKVSYRSVALAMQALGVKACLATAAVGSLRREWGPGTFVACSDFLDFTFRNPTLFDRQVVHRDFTDPFDPAARAALIEAGREVGRPVEPTGVYLAGNGPRYETPQEIRMYEKLGGDLVGMTATTEAILFREALVPYGCLAIVTNFASGISETPLDHQEVVDEMVRSGETAVQLLLRAARKLAA